MEIIINDLPITCPFRVYDRTTGHFIFSLLDLSNGGDVPPDVAFLPVVSIRSIGDVLYIDTKTTI